MRKSSRQSEGLEYAAGEIGNRHSPTGCGRHTPVEAMQTKGPFISLVAQRGEWSLATVEVKDAKAKQSSLDS